jgi:hypothetical protein
MSQTQAVGQPMPAPVLKETSCCMAMLPHAPPAPPLLPCARSRPAHASPVLALARLGAVRRPGAPLDAHVQQQAAGGAPLKGEHITCGSSSAHV